MVCLRLGKRLFRSWDMRLENQFTFGAPKALNSEHIGMFPVHRRQNRIAWSMLIPCDMWVVLFFVFRSSDVKGEVTLEVLWGGQSRLCKHQHPLLLSSALPSLPLLLSSSSPAQVRADCGCWHVMNSVSHHLVSCDTATPCFEAHAWQIPLNTTLLGHCNWRFPWTPGSGVLCCQGQAADLVHSVQNVLYLHSSGCTSDMGDQHCEYCH